MADTQRSLSDLQTLFADNITRAISEQDLRDFLVSVRPPHGTMYMTTPAETVITGAGTWTKAAGTSTLLLGTNYSMPANNRLQYDGVPDRHTHVAVTIAFTVTTGSQELQFRIVKNGQTTDNDAVASTVATKLGGSDVASTALHYDVTMSTGDYLELYVNNATSAANMTVQYMYFFALGVLT